MDLPRLPRDSFSWSRWRRFGLFAALGRACRTGDIVRSSEELRRHAVGWLEGEKLPCRPKENTVAVMWLEDGYFTWCHLSNLEFFSVFGIDTYKISDLG